MVPYVRRSFYKHYKDGAKYLKDVDFSLEGNIDEVSIEAETYQSMPEVYRYAMDMTKRELNQAVEGMYHNLNTLQSRSGNQLDVAG